MKVIFLARIKQKSCVNLQFLATNSDMYKDTINSEFCRFVLGKPEYVNFRLWCVYCIKLVYIAQPVDFAISVQQQT